MIPACLRRGFILAFLSLGVRTPLWCAPALRIDEAPISGLRISSKVFLLRVPVENTGDEVLKITRVRSTCTVCVKSTASKQLLAPDENHRTSRWRGMLVNSRPSSCPLFK